MLLDITRFISLQLNVFLGAGPATPNHFLYQLGLGSPYIGRAAILRRTGAMPGGAARCSEHFKMMHRFVNGALGPKKRSCRHRYKTLYEADGDTFSMTAIMAVPADQASAMEAARISYSTPAANGTLGAKGNGTSLWTLDRPPRDSRGRPRMRRNRSLRRKTEDIVNATVNQNATFFEAAIDNKVMSFICKSLFLGRRLQTRHLLARHFLAVYDHFMRAHVTSTGAAGPLNLYDAGLRLLLIRFAAWKPKSVTWARVVSDRYGNRDVLTHMWQMMGLLPHFRDKLRARADLELTMREFGLPPPKTVTVTIPHSSWIAPLRSWMGNVIKLVQTALPFTSAMIKSSTRMAVQADLPAKRRVPNMARTVMEFDVEMLQNLTQKDLALAVSGADLSRMTLHGRSPSGAFGDLGTSEGHSSAVKAAWSQCGMWLRAFGIFDLVSGRLGWPHLQTISQKNGILETIRSDQATFLSSAENVAITVEDKDPNIFWVGNSLLSTVRWLTQFSAAKDRWKFVTTPMDQVVSWYRLLFDYTIPKNLHTRSSCISAWNLPYIYETIKGKCWSSTAVIVDGQGETKHTCTKPGHSCMRNICSFIRFPGRKLYQRFGKAPTFLSNVFAKGWSFKNLDTAFDELRARVDLLEKPAKFSGKPCHICAQCCQEMSSPGLVVGDAGQAYEALKRERITIALDFIFTEANKQNSTKAVYVTHEQPARVGFGGDISTPYRDRTVLLAKSVHRCILGFLGMRFFRLGAYFMLQIDGIPIGGPLSGQILDAVLSFLEFLFDARWTTRQRKIASGRFADDLILLSYVWCSDCLWGMVHDVYDGAVCFSRDDGAVTTSGGTIIQGYLDGIIHFNFASFSVYAKHKNEEFGFIGTQDLVSKHSTLPFMGKFDAKIKNTHRAELKGRIHRWSSIGVTEANMMILVATDCLVYIRNGFSFKQIRRIWMGITKDPRLSKLFFQTLRLVELTSSHITIPLGDQVVRLLADGEAIADQIALARDPSLTSRPQMGWGDNGKGWGQQYGNYTGAKGHGKPYGGGRPWNGGNGGGPGPSSSGSLGGLAANFSQCMGEIQAFSQMAHVGQVLNASPGLLGSGQSAPPPLMPQPAIAGGGSGVAQQAAQALIAVLEQDKTTSSSQDTKVTETIKRLAAMTNIRDSVAEEAEWELNPAFKKLKAQVASISEDVGKHTTQIAKVQQTVDKTSEGVDTIKLMLTELTNARQARDHQAPPPAAACEAGGGGLPVGAGAPRGPPPGLNGGLPGGAAGPAPYFGPMITYDMTTDLYPLLGITLARREVALIREALRANGPMTFRAWWAETGKLKGVAQWRTKMQNIGIPDGIVDHLSSTEIGELLYQRLTDEAIFAGANLQGPPA